MLIDLLSLRLSRRMGPRGVRTVEKHLRRETSSLMDVGRTPGPRPTPSSALLGGIDIASRCGSRGPRADQGVRPTTDYCFVEAVTVLGPSSNPSMTIFPGGRADAGCCAAIWRAAVNSVSNCLPMS